MALDHTERPDVKKKTHYFYSPSAGLLVCLTLPSGKRLQLKFRDHHYQTDDLEVYKAVKANGGYRQYYHEVTGRVPMPSISSLVETSTGRAIDQDLVLIAKARADGLAASMAPLDEQQAEDLELTSVQRNRNALRMDADKATVEAKDAEKREILSAAERARRAYGIEKPTDAPINNRPDGYGVDPDTGEKVIVADVQDE